MGKHETMSPVQVFRMGYIYIHRDTCVNVHTYVCAHTYIYTHTHNTTHTCMHAHTRAHTHTRTKPHAHTHAHTHFGYHCFDPPTPGELWVTLPPWVRLQRLQDQKHPVCLLLGMVHFNICLLQLGIQIDR